MKRFQFIASRKHEWVAAFTMRCLSADAEQCLFMWLEVRYVYTNNIEHHSELAGGAVVMLKHLKEYRL